MRIRARRPLVAVIALSIVPFAFADGSVGAQDLPGEPVDAEPVDQINPFVAPAAPAVGDFAYDRWNDRWGQSLADVSVGTPADESVELFGALASPVDSGDQFATRMRTLLTPTEKGRYRFFVSGDDDVRLFLNPVGDDPAGARRIAYVAGWTTLYQWDRFASQRSDWFELEAGVPYYVEVIAKEGSGGDHASVAWQRTEDGPIELVPADVIESTTLGAGGWRTATPVGLPDQPAPMTDPQWHVAGGIETIDAAWRAVDGASRYEVRLEGAGQSRTVTVDTPYVSFSGLVPDTRYLLEVAPVSDAGRQPSVGRVAMTHPGPYPTPVAPEDGDRPSVTYDRWDTGWWTLTSIPDGLAPVSTATLDYGFETPPMLGENHAARLRAVLTPAETGDYTFFLSADDDARLLLNPSGSNADGAIPIASVAGWTEQYQWDRYDSQTSATFRLKKGDEYYVEAISVHGLGLDHLEVGWSRDGGAVEVIPNSVLTPTMAGSGAWRRDATSLPPVPDKPKHVEDDTTPYSVLLSWEAPEADAKHGAAVFYEVTLSDDDVTHRYLVESTEIVIDGLVADGKYRVELRAWNASGQSKVATRSIHLPKDKAAEEAEKAAEKAAKEAAEDAEEAAKEAAEAAEKAAKDAEEAAKEAAKDAAKDAKDAKQDDHGVGVLEAGVKVKQLTAVPNIGVFDVDDAEDAAAVDDLRIAPTAAAPALTPTLIEPAAASAPITSPVPSRRPTPAWRVLSAVGAKWPPAWAAYRLPA